MKTVIKIPIYLEIDTETTNRETIVNKVRAIFLDDLVSKLSAYANKFHFSVAEATEMQKHFGKFSIKVMTDREILKTKIAIPDTKFHFPKKDG